MKSYIDITEKYLKNQRKRTLLTIVGIILSVSLITAIGTMMMSLRELELSDTIKRNGDYFARFEDVPYDKVDKIINHTKIEKSGVVKSEGIALFYTIPEDKKNPYDPSDLYLDIGGFSKGAYDIFNVKLIEGRMPENNNEIIIPKEVLSYFDKNFKLGDSIELPFEKAIKKEKMGIDNNGLSNISELTEKRKFKVVGLIENPYYYSGNRFFKSYTILDTSKLNEGNYNAYIKLTSNWGIRDKVKEISKDVGHNDFTYNEGVLNFYAQSENNETNGALALIFLFLSSIIIVSTVAVIYNALNISVIERISQYGVLRCIGATPGQIRKTVFKEAFILCIFGIPLGLFLGIYAMKAVLIGIGSLITNIDFINELKIVISPIVIVVSSLLGILTVFLSARGPAKKASNVSPLDAVRDSGKFKTQDIKKVKKSIFARKIFGIEGDIAYKNLSRNRKRFRITVFSMVVSIILYIVFGSFVDYTFKMGAVDSKYHGDYHVSNSLGEINEDIYKEIKNLPGVDKVYKMNNHFGMSLKIEKDKVNKTLLKAYNIEREIEDGKVVIQNNEIKAYGDDTLLKLKDKLIAGEIDLEKMNKENGIIILNRGKIYYGNKSAVIEEKFDLKIGDKIKLNIQTDDFKNDRPIEKTVEFKVLGIIRETDIDQYSYNDGINIFITEKQYKEIYNRSNCNFTIIKLKDGADKKPVLDYIKELKKSQPNYAYYDYSEMERENRNMTIIAAIFLYGFVSVITLIGCLNIINTISTNILLRTRELAMLRAVGITKRGLKKLVFLEGIYYGIVAAIYGGLIGTGLSFILFKIMLQITEFEWGVPYGKIITAVLGCTIVAIISSLIPLKRVNEGIIVENIRMQE